MGLFGRRTRDDQGELPKVTPPIDDVLLRAILEGETITRDKALTLPAVSGAVDFIANCVACMPVKLYKYRDGKVVELENDQRVRLLNGDTGDTLDAWQMKKAMVEDYLLGKGGYCYIRKSRNDVTGLFYVEEQYITIMKMPEPIYKKYVISVMGKDYKPYEFVKLLRNTKDGASGTGLTVEVSKALEAAYRTLIYQLANVSAGGSKKGFLKSQRKLAQEEINALKDAWKRLYSSGEENVVVLNNGLDFQEANASSVEMQINESKRTFQDEINDLFHISPDFYTTFKFAIYPIVKAFETALNRDLLLEKEKKNYYFEFDVKEIVKANLEERYRAYQTAKQTGFMTINEIRRAENMNYIEGMDVVNVGLGAVLYEVNSQTYFTPNTGEVTDPKNPKQDIPPDMPEEQPPEGVNPEEENNMLMSHLMEQEFEQDGNSSDA